MGHSSREIDQNADRQDPQPGVSCLEAVQPSDEVAMHKRNCLGHHGRRRA